MAASSRVAISHAIAIGLLYALIVPGDIRAQPATAPADILARAQTALDAGAYQEAADLVTPLLRYQPDATGANTPERATLAEAWRVYGLAMYHLTRYEGARIAFFEYLKLDVDARLDPALAPPELVAFFEDVRTRNAAELRKYRRDPGKRRSWALNLVPPAGQFQNGHRVKGWLIGGLGSAALTVNLGTYFTLRRWCDRDTGLCESNGASREGEARLLRTINLISGVTLIGVYVYGLVDGFSNYKHRPREPSLSVDWTPVPVGRGILVNARIRADWGL